MTNSSKNTPKLRFKEFDSVWVFAKLQDCVDDLSSGVSVNSEDEPVSRDGDFGILKTSCVFQGRFIESENKRISAPEEVKRAKLNPMEGHILVSRMNTPLLVGESGYVHKSFYHLFVPDRLWAIKTKREISSKWLSYFLTTERTRSILTSMATGTSGSMKNISQPNFLGIRLGMPALPEQQKIASFLSSVDTKIQQLTKKKELLEQYKKGVMQQLFPPAGGQTPAIRFKDENGKEFPKWEEKRIGDFLTESRIKGDRGDVAKKITVKLYGRGVYSKEDKIQGSSQTQYFVRRAGQFIYSKLDFLNCAFGIVPKELDGYQSTVDLPSFDISSKLNPKLLLEIVKLKSFYKRFGDTADGSRKAKRIHADVFCSFLIMIPCLGEQQKIARLLSALDAKIESVAAQIAHTQTFKKGLLQQMFV